MEQTIYLNINQFNWLDFFLSFFSFWNKEDIFVENKELTLLFFFFFGFLTE